MISLLNAFDWEVKLNTLILLFTNVFVKSNCEGVIILCRISSTESKDLLIKKFFKVIPVTVLIGSVLICLCDFFCGGQPWFSSEGATCFLFCVSVCSDSSPEVLAGDTNVTLLQCILEVAMQQDYSSRCLPIALQVIAFSVWGHLFPADRPRASEFWSA